MFAQSSGEASETSINAPLLKAPSTRRRQILHLPGNLWPDPIIHAFTRYEVALFGHAPGYRSIINLNLLIMEQSVFTLKDLNFYAAFMGFALVEENGSFYWKGYDKYTSLLLAKKYVSAVHTGSFSALSKERWMDILTEAGMSVIMNEFIW